MSFIWDVFISYSTKDKERVSFIVKDLVNVGFKVWYDRTIVKVGERLRAEINHGIENSATVVIFISQNSLNSQWVLNELDAAMLREINERKTIVLPVLIGRIKEDQLPGDLRGKRHIDLRHNFQKRYEQRAVEIYAAIRVGSSISTEPLNGEVIVGDELVEFLLNYKYSGEYLTEQLPPKVIEVFAEGLIAALLEDKESVEKMMDFLNEYGAFTVRKFMIFLLDHYRLDLTGGVSEESLNQVLSDVQLLGMFYSINKRLSEEEKLRDIKIVLGITKDGELASRMVKTVTVSDED